MLLTWCGLSDVMWFSIHLLQDRHMNYVSDRCARLKQRNWEVYLV